MPKCVTGFSVKGQHRTRIRGDIAGEFEGKKWLVRSERTGVFLWMIGLMTGYDGPTLRDVLRTMKKAAKAQDKLKEIYGSVPEDRLNILSRILRWEQRAVQGRLSITGPYGKDQDSYFKVAESPY